MRPVTVPTVAGSAVVVGSEGAGMDVELEQAAIATAARSSSADFTHQL
jgi:hypothetical protein